MAKTKNRICDLLELFWLKLTSGTRLVRLPVAIQTTGGPRDSRALTVGVPGLGVTVLGQYFLLKRSSGQDMAQRTCSPSSATISGRPTRSAEPSSLRSSEPLTGACLHALVGHLGY